MNLFTADKQVSCSKNYKHKDKIIMLPVCDIAPNPLQPRKHFDEEEITFLAESIKQYGLIQPIAVKRSDELPCININNEKIRSSEYEIIAGERRWRAAKRAGLKKIPCIIFQTDKQGSALLALEENIQRKELNIFEEAAAIQNLLLMTELTQVELAKKLSVSQSCISNKLRLLKLTAAERAFICGAALTERHARALVRIENENTRMFLLKKMVEKNMSASEAEKLVDDFLKGVFQKDNPKEKEVAKKPTRIGVIKDMRFFFNTLDRATALLQDAGISTKTERVEHDEYMEVIIKVAKDKIQKKA